MSKLEYRFTHKDMNIGEEYSFIGKELEEVEFYIEISDENLAEVIHEGRSFDMMCDIGYYLFYKMDGHSAWIDMLNEIVDKKEFTEEEYDKYIDFQGIFQEECVKQFKAFEERAL